MEQTAVEWFYDKVIQKQYKDIDDSLEDLFQQAKEMEEQQSQAYAEFCINCYREDYPILDFESYIKVKEIHGQSNI